METTTQTPAFKTFNSSDRVGSWGKSGGAMLAMLGAFLGAVVLAVIGEHVDTSNHPNEWMSGFDGLGIGIAVGIASGPMAVTLFCAFFKSEKVFFGALITTVVFCIPLLIWMASGDFFPTLESVRTYSDVSTGFGF